MDASFGRLIAGADQNNGDRATLELWYLSLRVKNLRPATFKCYSERMGWFLQHIARDGVSLRSCTRRDIEDYIRAHIDQVSAETTNGRIRVLRVFWRWATTELPAEFPEYIPMGIKLVRYDRKLRPVLTPAMIASLIGATNKRNRALVMIMFDGMLRSSEARSLMVEDVDCINQQVTIRRTKSRHPRIAPIGPETCLVVKSYMVGLNPSGYLFPGNNGKYLSDSGARMVLKRLADRIGVKGNPQLLRHSGVTAWLKKGGDSRIIQRALGHRSPVVIDQYIHVDADALVEAKDRASLFEGVHIRSR